MRQHTRPSKEPAEKVVQEIRRAARKHYSAEDKIRIVLEGLRGEDSIAELCRREGIAQNLYYRWSKDFLEAGKKRLAPSIECHDPLNAGLVLPFQRPRDGRSTLSVLPSLRPLGLLRCREPNP